MKKHCKTRAKYVRKHNKKYKARARTHARVHAKPVYLFSCIELWQDILQRRQTAITGSRFYDVAKIMCYHSLVLQNNLHVLLPEFLLSVICRLFPYIHTEDTTNRRVSHVYVCVRWPDMSFVNNFIAFSPPPASRAKAGPVVHYINLYTLASVATTKRAGGLGGLNSL